MGDKVKVAKGIGKFFDKTVNSDAPIEELGPLQETAQHHVDAIVDADAKSVVDVGSGGGRLIIGLLEAGVEEVTGIELSEKSNQIALKRLKHRGMEDRAILKTESFLDVELDGNPEAVSMHMVMCCHPDRKGMLAKSVESKPRIIVNTLPRDWFIFKVVFMILGIFTMIWSGGSFRAYVHKQKQIDNQLYSENYFLADRRIEGIKVTSVYLLKDD